MRCMCSVAKTITHINSGLFNREGITAADYLEPDSQATAWSVLIASCCLRECANVYISSPPATACLRAKINGVDFDKYPVARTEN
jgi:hypothetical protein